MLCTIKESERITPKLPKIICYGKRHLHKAAREIHPSRIRLPLKDAWFSKLIFPKLQRYKSKTKSLSALF